MTEAAQPS